MIRILKTLTLFLALDAGAAPALAAPAYVDATDYFSRDAGVSGLSLRAYYDALDSLVAQFDLICGDTFCEGEFSNLRSLGLDCSIDSGTHQVGQCVWTFAGSYAEIHPRTGRVAISRAVKVCELGVRGDVTAFASWLLAAAEPGYGNHGLRAAPIAGRADGKSLMDVLGDCL